MREFPKIIEPNVAKRKLMQIILFAFAIRLIILVFMLTVGQNITHPYFIADDIKYEDTAQYYLDYADSLIDSFLLDEITDVYLEPFWPIVMCISSYIFRTAFAARFINVIISTLCIKVIYDITHSISDNTRTALNAAKLFAFLPVTVLTCCFPIKDIFITLTVLYAFSIFIKVQNSEKIGILKWILCIVGLICTYYTRGAVVELLMVFFLIYFINKFIKAKKYVSTIFIALIAGVLFFFLKDSILDAFSVKIDDYGGYGSENAGNIAFLQINSITQIYKLPFTYFFATLQPIKLNFFAFNTENLWYSLLTLLNMTIYPVAIANFIYIFLKKHNFIFWLSSFIMYAAVISLSLGVFRHYLFLIPVQIINCSLCLEREDGKYKFMTVMATGAFTVLILTYSILVKFAPYI